jgi:hypothetical protein
VQLKSITAIGMDMAISTDINSPALLHRSGTDALAEAGLLGENLGGVK